MKILSWIAGIAVCGLGMMVLGFLDRRDGLTIGGSIFIGSALIAFALLASAKK